jgi:glycosyltransferase involved in cell wall biosynthesis
MMAAKNTKNPKPLISIVSPVYKAESIVEAFVARAIEAVTKITRDYEIILVDDGSPDRSWEKIVHTCSENDRVKGVRLSRNFGQHSAINACLEYSRGDFVVLMDCDLQDDPIYIQEMYQEMDQTDYVITRRREKKQTFTRKILGNYFYKVYSWLAGDQLDWSIGLFSMLSRKVVDSYLRVGDYNRYYLLVLSWLGFSHKVIEVENRERYSGRSSYTLDRLIRIAFSSIISNSDKLLSLSVVMGMIFITLSVLSGLYIIIDMVIFGATFAQGWPSVFVLLLFSTGIILFCLGIAALYIGSIFSQVKGRPRYVVREFTNF